MSILRGRQNVVESSFTATNQGLLTLYKRRRFKSGVLYEYSSPLTRVAHSVLLFEFLNFHALYVITFVQDRIAAIRCVVYAGDFPMLSLLACVMMCHCHPSVPTVLSSYSTTRKSSSSLCSVTKAAAAVVSLRTCAGFVADFNAGSDWTGLDESKGYF